MKHQRTTRRELLKRSAAFGTAALAGSAGLGMIGCGAQRHAELEVGKWQRLASPAPKGSICPRITSRPDGNAVLTWLEPLEDRKANLRLSIWRGANWSEPATIATNLAFSRDQAAAPGVIGLSNASTMAYWSQRVSADQHVTNEIALYMAISNDGGVRWSEPILVNRATAQPGEDNAYASGVALDGRQAQLVWLDGREWEKLKHVQLMTRDVNLDGSLSEARLLDPNTCTCCSTAIVKTPKGLLAAYRGHNDANIRDISLVHTEAAGWSQPRVPYADGWHIEACPVNGPHLDARNENIALVWFTAPQDQPAVKLAFSLDGGAHFISPVRLDTARAIGRAQVAALSDGSAVGFWLESDAEGTRLAARRVLSDGGMGAALELARGENFGYPHMAKTAAGILVAWAQRNPTSEVHVGLLQTTLV